MGRNIEDLPLELLQRIASFASTNTPPIAIRDLPVAKNQIIEFFRGSRLLTNVFLKDFARNNYVELSSVDLLRQNRALFHPGHLTFGRDATLLTFHPSKIRNLQIYVHLGWQHGRQRGPEDFKAFAHMINFIPVIRNTFPNLTNLAVKLEWVAPFGNEFSWRLLDLYEDVGREKVDSLIGGLGALFEMLHKVEVEGKTVICEQTRSETDFSKTDATEIKDQMCSHTVLPGCAPLDMHMRERLVHWAYSEGEDA